MVIVPDLTITSLVPLYTPWCTQGR